jgi:hypothetical protein
MRSSSDWGLGELHLQVNKSIGGKQGGRNVSQIIINSTRPGIKVTQIMHTLALSADPEHLKA